MYITTCTYIQRNKPLVAIQPLSSEARLRREPSIFLKSRRRRVFVKLEWWSGRLGYVRCIDITTRYFALNRHAKIRKAIRGMRSMPFLFHLYALEGKRTSYTTAATDERQLELASTGHGCSVVWRAPLICPDV